MSLGQWLCYGSAWIGLAACLYWMVKGAEAVKHRSQRAKSRPGDKARRGGS